MDFKFFDMKPLSALGQVIESIGMEHDTQNKCLVCSMALLNDYMMDVRENQSNLTPEFRIGVGFIHESCCRCSVCGIGLDQKCHEKNGRIFCEEHYYREFPAYKCNGCKEGISPKEMVYKLKCGMTYHISCHACYRCGRPLAPGDQIMVDSMAKSVSCVNLMCSEMPLPIPCEESFPSTSSIGYDQQPNSQFNAFEIKKEVDTYGYNFDNFPFADFCDDDSKFLKRRGPRTTIKQNQLDVLNKIFSTTPKPSKHSRAKLALETGLSMRVIQLDESQCSDYLRPARHIKTSKEKTVWFQNRRSKERRLKHLCNYLRHYEQRGILPPHININPETGAPCDLSSFHQMMLEQQPFEDDDELEE